MTFPCGAEVLFDNDGMWIRVRVMYCSRFGKRIRVKWQDKQGQHIEYVGFTKLVPLEGV